MKDIWENSVVFFVILCGMLAIVVLLSIKWAGEEIQYDPYRKIPREYFTPEVPYEMYAPRLKFTPEMEGVR